jgi:hypothetical protein
MKRLRIFDASLDFHHILKKETPGVTYVLEKVLFQHDEPSKT